MIRWLESRQNTITKASNWDWTLQKRGREKLKLNIDRWKGIIYHNPIVTFGNCLVFSCSSSRLELKMYVELLANSLYHATRLTYVNIYMQFEQFFLLLHLIVLAWLLFPCNRSVVPWKSSWHFFPRNNETQLSINAH